MRTADDRIRTAAMDWEDVRHFAALARAGTLSGAARALRVHHATVARRVTRLEAALGEGVFERRGGRYVLTVKGERALERAVEMERSADALVEGTAGTPTRVCVRVTSTRSILDGFLLPRLAPLVAQHPELELELLGDSRPLSLARHEADIAIRMGAPRRGEIVGRRIATLVYGFYATPALAAALANGAPPRRIGFDEASAAIPEAAWLAVTYPEDRPAYRASSFLSQQLAARAGLGVALLPRFMGDADPALVRVPQEPLPPTRPVWLLRRRGSRAFPHIRAVADFLIGVFERDGGLFFGRGG